LSVTFCNFNKFGLLTSQCSVATQSMCGGKLCKFLVDAFTRFHTLYSSAEIFKKLLRSDKVTESLKVETFFWDTV